MYLTTKGSEPSSPAKTPGRLRNWNLKSQMQARLQAVTNQSGSLPSHLSRYRLPAIPCPSFPWGHLRPSSDTIDTRGWLRNESRIHPLQPIVPTNAFPAVFTGAQIVLETTVRTRLHLPLMKTLAALAEFVTTTLNAHQRDVGRCGTTGRIRCYPSNRASNRSKRSRLRPQTTRRSTTQKQELHLTDCGVGAFEGLGPI